MHLRSQLLIWVSILLLSSSFGLAQSTTGTLVGTVTDPSGAAMAGVSVVAIEVDTNYSRPATTNESGNYSISNLSSGQYQVEFTRQGFKTLVQREVQVGVNATTRLNIPMEVGTLEEVVNVTFNAPLLQKDTSSTGGTIDARMIEDLPVSSRFLEELFRTLPGISSSAPNSHLSNRGGINAGGFDEHYASFLIDGIDNVDPVIRNFSYRPSLDIVREVRIDESGYGAEFGRNAGAVINVTTRSGTNALHGSAWEFFRNDNLDARNFFAPAGISKPSLIRNQFGGTLGGALKQNKTFFFAGFEGLRQKTGMVRRATVPTELMRAGILTEVPAMFIDPQTLQPFQGNVIPDNRIHPLSREVLDAIPHPNLPGLAGNRIEIANRIDNGIDFSGRVDHQWTAGTKVMGRYSTSVTHILDPFRTETTGASNLSEFGQTADRFRTNLGITLTTVKGQSIVNELRAGYNRFRQPQLPTNPGTPGQQPLMGFVKTFLAFRIGSSLDPWGSNAEFKRAVNVYNYVDNVTWVQGNHQFKFGADARRYLFNAYNVTPNQLFFTGARTAVPGAPISSTGSDMADYLLGLPTQVVSFNGDPGGNTRKFEFAAYLQDDWKISPRLTLNYGLRWEFYGRITEKINKQSFWVPDCNCMRVAGVDASPGLVDNDFNNFAPRLGFAWRPFGERTVLRAASGIFYDSDMRHNAEAFSNPPFFFTREYTLPVSLSDPFTAAAVSSTLRPATFDKKFRDTYAEQWSISIQHELAANFVAEVSYVGNHSVKARRLRNVNQAVNGVLPYAGFASILLFEQAGSSNYNALQVWLQRRLSRGLAFTSAYTWGHAIDDRPGQGAGLSQNNYDMRAERGNADFDVRHRWVVTGTYGLPFGAGKPWGGWSLNAISTLQSGRPFTVTLPFPYGLNGTRPDVAPEVDWEPSNQGPDHWINPAAFQSPANGLFGSLGRNTLAGPGLYNLDVSLTQNHAMGDSRQLQLRAEFFNVLNHPNFGLPNNAMGTSLGLISATSSPERQIQLGIRLRF